MFGKQPITTSTIGICLLLGKCTYAHSKAQSCIVGNAVHRDYTESVARHSLSRSRTGRHLQCKGKLCESEHKHLGRAVQAGRIDASKHSSIMWKDKQCSVSE